MRGSGFHSMAELARGLREDKRLPGDVAQRLAYAFSLPAAALKVRQDGGCLVLSTADKTVRYALTGMEGNLLRWLSEEGYSEIRSVRWSAG